MKKNKSSNKWTNDHGTKVILVVAALLAIVGVGNLLIERKTHNPVTTDESTSEEKQASGLYEPAEFNVGDQLAEIGLKAAEAALAALPEKSALYQLTDGISMVSIENLDLPKEAELVVLSSNTEVKYYIGNPWNPVNLKPIYGCTMTLTGVNPTTKHRRELASFEIRSDGRDDELGLDYEYSVLQRGLFANHREWFSSDFSKMAATRTYYPKDDNSAEELPLNRVGWLTQEGEFCDVTDYLSVTYEKGLSFLGTIGFLDTHMIYGKGFNEEAETFCLLSEIDGEMKLQVVLVEDLLEAMEHGWVLDTSSTFDNRTHKSETMQIFLNNWDNIRPTSEFMTPSENFVLLADVNNTSNLIDICEDDSFVTSSWCVRSEDFCGWNGLIDGSGSFAAFMVAETEKFDECIKKAELQAEGKDDASDDEEVEEFVQNETDVDPESSEQDEDSDGNIDQDSDESESSETSPTEVVIINAEKCYAAKVDLGVELSPPGADWTYSSNYCILCGWTNTSTMGSSK